MHTHYTHTHYTQHTLVTIKTGGFYLFFGSHFFLEVGYLTGLDLFLPMMTCVDLALEPRASIHY